MEIWYNVFVNHGKGEPRELAQSRSTDFGETVRLCVKWTEISAEGKFNHIYAPACVVPLGGKWKWSKEQVDEFCSLTPDEAFKRLKVSN